MADKTENDHIFQAGETVFVKASTYSVSDEAKAYVGRTAEEHVASQRAKVVKFFGGEEHSTNYADLDDTRLMIDGVYDIDALIKLLQEI